MRLFFILLKHEIKGLLLSPSTYLVAMLFMVSMCLTYAIILQDFAVAAKSKPPAELFFSFFVIPTLFMIPLITMRSIAEERRTGTLGAMLTTMVTPTTFVLCKYLSAYFFYITLWIMTVIIPAIVIWSLPASVSIFEPSTMLGGYIFIALSGLVYIAVGIFSSSLTRSQLVAGMLSFCILFLLIVGGRLLMDIPLSESEHVNSLEGIINYIQVFDHQRDFSKGLIDSRPVFLYISSAVLLLWLSVRVVEAKA